MLQTSDRECAIDGERRVERSSADALATVVLVDEHDAERGTASKLRAHREGLLHRACSVFVFDSAGRLLLQRRAASKYHSPNRWSNTCCGHPLPGEEPAGAARRRLREEMGFECPLVHRGALVYQAVLDNGLVEHEYDHLFVGWFNGQPNPNSDEVSDWKWESLDEVRRDALARPELYTKWLPLALEQLARRPNPMEAS